MPGGKFTETVELGVEGVMREERGCSDLEVFDVCIVEPKGMPLKAEPRGTTGCVIVFITA